MPRVIEVVPTPKTSEGKPYVVNGSEWTLRSFLRAAICAHPTLARGTENIRKGADLLKAIAADGNQIRLSDEQYVLLFEAVDKAPWTGEVIFGCLNGAAYVEAVMNAKEVK